MMNACPSFEHLSRFSDGALEVPEEQAIAVHLGGCPACRAVLDDLEGVDALVTMALSGRRRGWRLLRPAMVPVAAALLLGLTIGWLLSMPAAGGDSPLAVAEAGPTPFEGPRGVPAEPVKGVFCQDRFADPRLSPLWKTSEELSAGNPIVEAQGRRALSLVTHPGGKKRWALASTAGDFPVGEGVSFDVDYRVPRPAKGGRMQVLLQSSAAKGSRSVLRWSRTQDEELLEAQAEGRGKASVLWSSREGSPDGEWHRVKLTVTARDVVLHRDGVEAVRRAHGLELERAALTVGSTADRKGRDLREPFECQVGGLTVRRE